MPRLGRAAESCLEHYLLSGTKSDGPMLGYCAGQPIWEAIVDGLGRRYVFAGVAVYRRDGGVDVAALGRGEWLLEPGLIYRQDRSEKPWRRHFRRLTPASLILATLARRE
jgi:hypothetical protein